MHLNSPIPINKSHNCAAFDCGIPVLNEFLQKYALQNHNSDSARTFVALKDNNIVAFYSLAFGSVSLEDTPARIKKGLPRHPIPIMLLARLAVDKAMQGVGLGKGLLKNAFLRTVQASESGGLRAMMVHAKDKDAKDFYMKYGFEPSPIDEYHLYILIKDIRNAVGTN